MILCHFKKPLFYQPLPFYWKNMNPSFCENFENSTPTPYPPTNTLALYKEGGSHYEGFCFSWIFNYKETSSFSWKVETMLKEGRSETSIARWLYVLDWEHFSSHYVQFKRRISSEICYLYFSTISSLFGKSVSIRKKCENTIQVTYLDHFCEMIWRPSDKSGQVVWISMFLRACSFPWDYDQLTLVYQSSLPGCGYNWSNC